MKFLLDVHISMKLVNTIKKSGFECIHINSILDSWYTKDYKISKYTDQFGYILITKDSDFRDSHYLKNIPKKLIKINLGNISNILLIEIIINNLPKILELDKSEFFIFEIDKNYSVFS